MKENIQASVIQQRKFFATNKTYEYSFRIKQLTQFKKMLLENETVILDALKSDLGKHHFEGYTSEYSLVLAEIKHAIKHLRRWMKPNRKRTTIQSFGARSKVLSTPKGVCLIMSPWNYPFMLTLAPVIASMAAGNCTVIKPSSYSPNTSSIIQKLIKQYFDSEYLTVFQGNREINGYLLEEHFDHIFFTGSVKVGKIVMSAAANFLTPITLELGGKNPCIIDKDADLKKTAKRIVWGKSLNAGQTCVAPDYLLVHKSIKEPLIQAMIAAKKAFYGSDMLSSDSYGKIIRRQAYDQLRSLLENQEIIEGGAYNDETLKLELTFLNEPSLDSKVMAGEIFGPILPIISYESIDEVKNIISRYDAPLSLYVFSKNKALIKDLTTTIPFGGGCVNDVVVHVANGHLPFGGVGSSGMGAYHGKYGFDTFSHPKSILTQNLIIDIPIRYAPYKDKLKLTKKIIS